MEQSPPIGQRPRLILKSGGGGYRPSPFEIIALAVGLLLSLYGGYTAYARFLDNETAPPPAQNFAPAVRTTISSSVSATGTVQSSQQVSLTFDVGTGGGKIKEFLVKLGDQVVAGQPLARLDDSDLQQALKSAESSLASAQARVDAAYRGPTNADRASSEQSVISARGQVATAQQNLDDLRAKPTLADMATAQQAVLTATSAVQSAQDALVKAQNDAVSAQNDLASASLKVTSACAPPAVSTTPSAGGSSGSSSTACFDAQNAYTKSQMALAAAQNAVQNGNLQRAIQNAQVGLSSAQQKFQETAAGAKPSEIEAAMRALESAQASVVTAEERYRESLEPPKADVVLPLQASVDQARATVETAKKALAAATITAPFDGQISQLNGEVGTQVASNTVIFILLNPRTLRLDANVDQAYVNDLRAGQTATVTFDALQGRSYQAAVTAVGLTPTVQQGVVSYVVTLGIDTTRIPQGTPVPTPGMTASISVTTSRTDGAVAVPSRAIRRIGRNQTVTVKTASGETEQRNVTTGVTNGTLIQVTSGLEEGEEVLVSTPASSTTPQRTGTGTGTGTGGGGFGGPGGFGPP